MPADEKDESKKIESSGEGTVFMDRCVEDWVALFTWYNQIW